jgi:uncharacterized protein YjdB
MKTLKRFYSAFSLSATSMAIVGALALIGAISGCQVPISVTQDKPVTGVTLNKSSLTLAQGSTERLIATVLPNGASNQAVSWSCSNANASVSATGVVTANGIGIATVTVTTMDGSFTDSCAVTVTEPPVPVTGISLNKSATSLIIGRTERLVATIAPSNAANKTVTWSSSGPSALVSSDGLVTAAAVGSATITAASVDGAFTASCAVTVLPIAVTGVSLDKASITLPLDRTAQLVATVAPADSTDKSVVWSSSGAGASVSSSGLVTAIALGSATVTVTTVDGSFSKSCAVTVIPVPVSGITLNKASATLAAGQSETLVATVAPSDAANKQLTWATSDVNVAAVSDGQVLAISAGSATITATTVDGAFAASCVVTVTGSLSHTYAEVLPAATALQNGLNAAVASNDSTAAAYCEYYTTPVRLLICHLNGYVDSGYALSGAVNALVNADLTVGAMNGAVQFTGGVVTEISYVDALFTIPRSGSLGIKFSDGAKGTLNLATGVFTQD